MNNNDLLDMSESSYNEGQHSGARTLMIIMTVLWSVLLLVDLIFLTVFSFIFSIANAFDNNGSMDWPFELSLMYWNFALYPVMFAVSLIGGFTSLSKRNYSSVYIFGLLPLISIIVFFVALLLLPSVDSPTAF